MNKLTHCALLAFLLTLSVITVTPSHAQPAVDDNIAIQSTQININTASAEQLAAAISGIGLKKANAIVAYRQQHGPFKKLEELANIKGIGEKTIAKNRDKMRVK